MRAPAVMLLFVGLCVTACHRGPIIPLAPLHTGIPDPSTDHLKLASNYAREAMKSRQMAQEQANRAIVYERLFGPESDWVAGARLLIQFYEDSARELDQQANLHVELAGKRRLDRLVKE